MELNDLYRDVILDHNRHPRNFGVLEPADASAEGFNPMCGDRLTAAYIKQEMLAFRNGDRRYPFRRSGLRDLDGFGLAHDGGRKRQNPHRGRCPLRASASLVDRRCRSQRPTRQAGRAVGSSRVSRTRQMRESVLAHARLRPAIGRPPAPACRFHGMSSRTHAFVRK